MKLTQQLAVLDCKTLQKMMRNIFDEGMRSSSRTGEDLKRWRDSEIYKEITSNKESGDINYLDFNYSIGKGDYYG